MTTGPRHVVGIDLGTSHTVVAHAPLPPEGGAAGAVSTLPIPQLVTAGTADDRPLLPSVLLWPTDGEVDPTRLRDGWLVGEHARARAQETEGRAITSAKSWLGHDGVDRTAPLLPWGADDDSVPRLSPVDASRRVLDHVRDAWDQRFPDASLSAQHVVLTVPASFDQGARELTVAAAREAGLDVRLLEEPQAAFYDHLAGPDGDALTTLLRDGEEGVDVLVCDVGGGTTDLTLIRVDRAGDLERVAVGRHLLLGGDNMDLALAHGVERQLQSAGTLKQKLEPARFTRLVQACRDAKERLLAAEPADEVPIRLVGSGSSLVGATLRATLTRADVEAVVLDGFLPVVAPGARPAVKRGGLVAFGLPYEADAAISRHLAAFLARHRSDRRLAAVLPNGGVFRAPRFTARLLDVLAGLAGEAPALLPAPVPDLAVARGAVAFGLSVAGHGRRIGAGSAHGYYLSVGTDRKALCVLPRGTPEGRPVRVEVDGLALTVGRTVRFDLHARDAGPVDTAGALVPLDDDAMTRLPPVSTRLPGEGGDPVSVALECELSAVGTLELAAVETASHGEPRHFRLAFDLRGREGDAEGMGAGDGARPSAAPHPPSTAPGAPASTGGGALGGNFPAAREAIERVFGKGRSDVKEREARDLPRELERLLGEKRRWTLAQSRALFDLIGPKRKARRRSADHERVFWNLAGYTLRPGFGAVGDGDRVAFLAPLFVQGLAHPSEARGWQQLLIAFRRIAGGLDEATQTAIRDLVDPFLAPADKKLKKPKGFKLQHPEEALELASWLERVDARRRADLGRWVLERTWTRRDPRLFAALGRLGGRVPIYGSAHQVVEPRIATRWVDHLLTERWDELPPAADAAARIARCSGDRSRDLPDGARARVADALERAGRSDAALLVREPHQESAQQAAVAYEEDLPPGLVLLTPVG